MNTLTIKTASNIIYVANGKVTCVRCAITGRFVKITAFIKVSAMRYTQAITKVVCNTSKFTNFNNTITLKKLLMAASNTLRPTLINGMEQSAYIKSMIKALKESDYAF